METVLIIESRTKNTEFLFKTLTDKFDCKVDVSKSSSESLSREAIDHYDIILIQHRMPELSGIQFVRRFRKKFPKSSTIVILISDLSQRDDIGEVFDAGADDFIMTPFIFSEVFSRIGHHLELARASKALKEQNTALEIAVNKATKELKASDERYKLATEASMNGIWDWHLDEGHIFYSEAWCRTLGFEKEEVPAIPLFWTNRVHPDDFNSFINAIDNHVRGLTNEIELEYRIRNRTGDYIWVKVKGKCIRSGDAKGPKRIVGAQTDISAVKEIQNQLLHNALHDTLTGLPNRTLFTERVNQAYLRFKRYPNEKYAVVFFDLDKFKEVNDVYGHSAGDKLLKHVSVILKESIREVDTVARLGGDEFVVLADQIKSIDDVVQMVERVFESAKRPILIGGEKIYCQFSVGLSVSKDTHVSADKVIKEADMALYQAKEAGRKQYVIYDPKVHKDTPRKVEMIASLASALDKDEIKVYYQPIIDTKENRIWGYEALLRWHHPTLGLVSPVDFIPLAEDNDMIIRLGDFVMNSSLKQLSKWRNKHIKVPGLKGVTEAKMCINVSSSQTLQPNFIDALKSLSELHEIHPNDIVLEFSEYHLSEIIKKNHSVLMELRERNFHLALDDFGEGRASIRSIVDYPLTVLKIDRSLTLDMESDQKKRKLFNLVLTLGAQSKLKMIIEGVQNESILDVVLKGGGELVQGFYFSKPSQPKDLDSESKILKKLSKIAS